MRFADPARSALLRLAGSAALPPIAVSLALSVLTVGRHAYWQDSSLYLTAVHDFAVLYPHGFSLYLLLCKAWSLLLSPVCDFTLAVHLFSSACAAGGAGTLALAAERLCGNRRAAACAGILAAAGYTWAFAAIYAKGYALYYLVLCLLLWRAARRDDRGAALLAGLSWSAHPSAALLLPAYAGWFLWRLKDPGFRRAGGAGAALALAGAGALAPLALLFAGSARASGSSLGDVRSLADLFDYVSGRRYTLDLPGVWGFEPSRWSGMGRLFLEEFLVVGLVAAAAGVVHLARERRLRLGALVLWVIPFAVVTAWFKIEGQQDLWMVVAYLPLHLACAAGVASVSRGRPWLPAAAAVAGLGSAAWANLRDLDQRNYDYAERFGLSYLERLEPGALLLVQSDEGVGLTRYLQRVRGRRTDVVLVNASLFLVPNSAGDWYGARLRSLHPDLRIPDLGAAGGSLPAILAGLARANAGSGRPIYMESDTALLGPGLQLIPAGMLWKLAPSSASPVPDVGSWKLPFTLETALAMPRDRRRAQLPLRGEGGELRVLPMSYRERIREFLLAVRQREAYAEHLRGGAEAARRSIALYEGIIAEEPAEAKRPEILLPLAGNWLALERPDRAEPLLRSLLDPEVPGAMAAAASLELAGLLERSGRRDEARAVLLRASKRSGIPAELRNRIDERLRIPP